MAADALSRGATFSRDATADGPTTTRAIAARLDELEQGMAELYRRLVAVAEELELDESGTHDPETGVWVPSYVGWPASAIGLEHATRLVHNAWQRASAPFFVAGDENDELSESARDHALHWLSEGERILVRALAGEAEPLEDLRPVLVPFGAHWEQVWKAPATPAPAAPPASARARRRSSRRTRPSRRRAPPGEPGRPSSREAAPA